MAIYIGDELIRLKAKKVITIEDLDSEITDLYNGNLYPNTYKVKNNVRIYRDFNGDCLKVAYKTVARKNDKSYKNKVQILRLEAI